MKTLYVFCEGRTEQRFCEQVLAPYLQRIVYIKQENKRASGARNTAILRAKGEFLAFLDSDDVWLPDHLSSQMKLFSENPALDLVYCDCYVFSDPARSETFMERCPSLGPATFDALIVERCQVPISTVVARKSAIVKAGLFDEKLARCDDYDMWLRTAFHGAKIEYSRKIQARLNEGRPGSLGVSDARMAEAAWIILDKLRQTLLLSDEDRRTIEKTSREMHARHLTEEGKVCLREGRVHEASEMFSQAIEYVPNPKTSMVLYGLKIAPRITSKLLSLRNGELPRR